MCGNSPALPETLEGFAHLGVEQISVDMGGLAILNVLLGVNEPRWHELQRVLDNSDDLIDLLGSQLAGTLLEVDLGLLAHHEGETATDTTDGGQGERHLVATVNIGIQYAQNVLELILREDKSHHHHDKTHSCRMFPQKSPNRASSSPHAPCGAG